jgi:hypothetical protein
MLAAIHALTLMDDCFGPRLLFSFVAGKTLVATTNRVPVSSAPRNDIAGRIQSARRAPRASRAMPLGHRFGFARWLRQADTRARSTKFFLGLRPCDGSLHANRAQAPFSWVWVPPEWRRDG